MSSQKIDLTSYYERELTRIHRAKALSADVLRGLAGAALESGKRRKRRGRPWEGLGLSRATYDRRKAEGSIGGSDGRQ